jgi:hypothetical protein
MVQFRNPDPDLRREYYQRLSPVLTGERFEIAIEQTEGFSLAQLRETYITRSNLPGRLSIAGSKHVGSLAVATTITPSCDPTPSRQLSKVWKLTVLSCVRLPSVGKARSRSSRSPQGQSPMYTLLYTDRT